MQETDDCPEVHPWDRSAILVGSGRQALALLIDHGRRTRGWLRLWVPTYFCQEVLEPLISAGTEIMTYSDGPGRPPPGLADVGCSKGDAILVVNQLGLRSMPDRSQLAGTGIEVIEDHTHDPWSPWAFSSEADFCLASLRKTLPLADGAAVWSPLLHGLPPEPTSTTEHELAAATLLEGALMKDLSIRGHRTGPDDYRPLVVAGEAALARAPHSAITALSRALLSIAPVARWREVRRENFEVLASELERRDDVEVLRPYEASAAPFAVTVRFSSKTERDRCREKLIASRIYPAILWPLEDQVVAPIPELDLSLSRQLLSFHCDMRSAPEDLIRVAATFARLRSEVVTTSAVATL